MRSLLPVQYKLVLVIDHKPLSPGVELITAAGRLMLGVESQRIETLTGELLAQGRRRLIFDLAGVTHIDSTGIGRFIAALNLAMRAGATLAIASATGQVRESFRVTRLDSIFKFYDDVETAHAAQ
jgi:anti-sigma B factor antagonist